MDKPQTIAEKAATPNPKGVQVVECVAVVRRLRLTFVFKIKLTILFKA